MKGLAGNQRFCHNCLDLWPEWLLTLKVSFKEVDLGPFNVSFFNKTVTMNRTETILYQVERRHC